MNGIDLYDQLQTIEEVADTPVIMLSANLPTKEIEER
jgi:CheY-like chemotaxis protein